MKNWNPFHLKTRHDLILFILKFYKFVEFMHKLFFKEEKKKNHYFSSLFFEHDYFGNIFYFKNIRWFDFYNFYFGKNSWCVHYYLSTLNISFPVNLLQSIFLLSFFFFFCSSYQLFCVLLYTTYLVAFVSLIGNVLSEVGTFLTYFTNLWKNDMMISITLGIWLF